MCLLTHLSRLKGCKHSSTRDGFLRVQSALQAVCLRVNDHVTKRFLNFSLDARQTVHFAVQFYGMDDIRLIILLQNLFKFTFRFG